MENTKLAENMIDLIHESKSPFHAIKVLKDSFVEKGFTYLDDNEKWNIEKGGKYFTVKNNKALVGFVVGDLKKEGFRIIGTHSDSPTFKIKPTNAIICENAYVKLNVEAYGGSILSTWFDRPLSIAGQIVVKTNNVFKPKEILVDINKPVLIIPSLAIHLNRDINNGYKYNKQSDMLPLLGFINNELEKDDYLLQLIANSANVAKEDILDFDLYLYEYEKGSIIGANNEFISQSRLDDLLMAFTGMWALQQSATEKTDATNVFVCVDGEEIGSTTMQGADSAYISNILKRISNCVNLNDEEYYMAVANSFMVSADLAHGVHPNYLDKHDPSNRPILGKGPVIKHSANQKYATTSTTAGIYKAICEKAKVPYQQFVNRSDLLGGSTIGPTLSSNLTIPTVDMGSAILGMHSVRELGAVCDVEYTLKSFIGVYGKFEN